MSEDRQSSRPPLVLTRLWEKKSGKGNRYMVGRLGGTKVLVMGNRNRDGDQDATHVLMVAEAADRRRESGGK